MKAGCFFLERNAIFSLRIGSPLPKLTAISFIPYNNPTLAFALARKFILIACGPPKFMNFFFIRRHPGKEFLLKVQDFDK